MAVTSLMIKGNFTEQDLMELSAAFRVVERRQPDQEFLFAILEADLSLAEGEALVKRIFPRVEGKEPFFHTARRDDPDESDEDDEG